MNAGIAAFWLLERSPQRSLPPSTSYLQQKPANPR